MVSGKGGVGKTTVTSNLGLALHRLGRETVVVDGDFKNPNLGLHLGMYEYDYDFQKVMREEKSILEALHIHRSGLRAIPASLSMEHLGTVADKLRDRFSEIKGHIFIDAPPGMSENVLSVLKSCDDVIIVTSPEITAVADALKMIELVRDMDKAMRGIIINRVGSKKYELSSGEIASVSGLEVMGEIPEDDNVKKSIRMKTPVVELEPVAPASIELKKIATEMVGEEYQKPSFLWLRRLFS